MISVTRMMVSSTVQWIAPPTHTLPLATKKKNSISMKKFLSKSSISLKKMSISSDTKIRDSLTEAFLKQEIRTSWQLGCLYFQMEGK